ncbi:MAG: hypothetical protein B6I17_03390 [Tenericutes bacterium 4572_104]|nr:MAG: hypothetical protein B6I17_03390 [Tenericutes bacterium 4572_104]
MSKLGLCLSGGGARGAYQIGAIKALEEFGILQKVQVFSGVSIGAVNAIFIASTPVDVAKDIWMNIPENPLGEKTSMIEKIKKNGFRVIDSGLFSLEKLDEILSENIDFKKIQKANVFIAISDTGESDKSILGLFKSTFDHYIKKDSKAVYVPINELDRKLQIETIKASCSIPIVFPPVVNNNKKYVDGGYFDNTPIQPLVDFGCDEVICIKIAFANHFRDLKKKYPNIKIHEIKSNKRLGGVLNFTSKHSRELYQLGYDDAINYIKTHEIITK